MANKHLKNSTELSLFKATRDESMSPSLKLLPLLSGSNQEEFGQENRQVYLSINLKNPLDILAEEQ